MEQNEPLQNNQKYCTNLTFTCWYNSSAFKTVETVRIIFTTMTLPERQPYNFHFTLLRLHSSVVTQSWIKLPASPLIPPTFAYYIKYFWKLPCPLWGLKCVVEERLGRRKEGSKRGEIKYIFFLPGIHNTFTKIVSLSLIKHFCTVGTDLTTVNGYILFLHKHKILSDRVNAEAGRRFNQGCKYEVCVCNAFSFIFR